MRNKKYTFMVSILTLFGALTIILSIFLIYNFYNRGLDNSYKILTEKNTEITKNISETIIDSMKGVERNLHILSKVTTSPLPHQYITWRSRRYRGTAHSHESRARNECCH